MVVVPYIPRGCCFNQEILEPGRILKEKAVLLFWKGKGPKEDRELWIFRQLFST